MPFVGNPNCGESHDPSDESGNDVPYGTYLCAEKNYLHKLADDNVDLSDPVALISAGYDHVCAILGPSDLDTPNLGDRETAAIEELLASGVLTLADIAKEGDVLATFIWFAVLFTLSGQLNEMGFMGFLGKRLAARLDGFSPLAAGVLLVTAYVLLPVAH